MIKLNRYVWRTLFIVFILLILTSFIENGGKVSGFSITCEKSTPCLNSFFRSFNTICEDSPEICETEYINPGETIGTTPAPFTKLFPLLSLFLLIFGILAEVYLRVVKK